MYAGYQGQYMPNIQGQPLGMGPGMPAATRPPQQVSNSKCDLIS